MHQVEHSAILLTFIKLPFVIKIFVLSIFEWPFYTGLTVYAYTGMMLVKMIKIGRSVVYKDRLIIFMPDRNR